MYEKGKLIIARGWSYLDGSIIVIPDKDSFRKYLLTACSHNIHELFLKTG